MAKYKNTQNAFEENDAKISLGATYNIDVSLYCDVAVTNFDFSVRLSNCLKRSGIHTVYDLLQKTQEDLFGIRNFGKTCWDEIVAFCTTIKRTSFNSRTNTLIESKCSGIDKDVFRNHICDILFGDFTFVENPKDIPKYYQFSLKYLNAYEILGAELSLKCMQQPNEIVSIRNMLSDFVFKTERLNKLKALVLAMPKIYQKKKATWYINAFTMDEIERTILLSYFSSKEDTLESIIYYDGEIRDSELVLLRDFFTWCNFDIYSDIDDLFKELFSSSKGARTRLILSYRAKKKTLEYIGNTLDVSRERIRQIESKVVRQFEKIRSRYHILSKIVAVRNGDSILSSDEIATYCGDNAELMLYLLRQSNSSYYTYDSRLDVFVVGNESLIERAFLCIESMPELIEINNADALIQDVCDNNDLDLEIIEKAFYESYSLSGTVYHRTALTRSKVYATILEEYYPNGIELYNPVELKTFRELVQSKFGDKTISKNDRALSARIADVCVLCGRGVYKLKQEKYISNRLAKKIYNYIVNNDSKVFLTNNLFSIFEEELVAEGIDNKYYMQGVLHELFDDEFVFRRDYIYTNSDLVSIHSDIVHFIGEFDAPINKTAIYERYPGITEIIINLAVSEREVLNYFGEYFCAKKLQISDEEIEYLRESIEESLKNGVCHSKDVYGIVVQARPEIFTRNFARYPFCAFSILEYLLADEYQFARPYIAKHGVAIGRASERLHDFVYSNEKFSISEISEFCRDNHFQINSLLEYVNGCNDEFLIINDDTMMRIDRTGIDESVAYKVESIISEAISETIPVKELSIWADLPAIKVPWTEWLIYSVVLKWGKKLIASTSSNQLKRAVPLVAPIDNYDPTAFKDIDKGDSVCSFVADDLSDMDSLLEDIMDDDFLDNFEV